MLAFIERGVLMIKKMVIAATAAAALSVSLAGLAWAEPPNEPGTTGVGNGGMPATLGNFVEHGIDPVDTGLKSPLPLGEVIKGLAKTSGVNAPDAVAGFEAGLWSSHTLADGTQISSDLEDWTNITPGLAIKPLGPGCGKGKTGLPSDAPVCVR